MSVVSNIAQPRVAFTLLDDLLELLWLEDVGAIRSRALPSRTKEDRVEILLGAVRFVGRVEVDRWRGGVRLRKLEDARTGRRVDAPEVLWHVLASLPNLDLATLDRTMGQLYESARNARSTEIAGLELLQKACSAENRSDFLIWERLAAWRDRPFHPLSRSRGGWRGEELRRYGAEFGALFALRWCAIPTGNVLASPAPTESDPVSALLDPLQAAAICDEMQRRGLSGTHLAMPLHPWQAETPLRTHFASEIAEGRIVLLDFQGPLVAATSSLRSVSILQRPERHLKLPLDVETLGVRRLMSAQSLHNGLKGAKLLTEALRLRPGLAQRARLADEASFWTFCEASRDVLEPRTAFLGCALRDLPPVDAGAALVPLASFAVAPVGDLAPAIRVALEERPGVTVDVFLRELFDLVLGFAVEALVCGFIPEMHGQNVLIELVGGRPQRLVLRDHDTVRCMPDRLRAAGLEAPDYIIKDPRRATMTLDRDEDLFAYAQTLLIDVALRAVCEALDASGNHDILLSRRVLREAVDTAVSKVNAEDECRARLRAVLLDASDWPFKQILTPLLATERFGLGMPSRLGRAGNPLRLPADAA